jgi:C4-dicarboxylate-specific signal transduction histidine kinase
MMAIREDLQHTATEADRRFRELRGLVEDAFRADPAEVFARSLDAHAAEMEDLGAAAAVELEGAPLVQMDVEELAFVVDNLVENAVRAMRGSPEKRLRVTWQEAGEHVVLLVGDTGCGIAPDELELVMKPGHSRRQGGGLGLPRSREILGKYGGGLSVKESSPGRGTTMSLLVPAAPRPTEAS